MSGPQFTSQQLAEACWERLVAHSYVDGCEKNVLAIISGTTMSAVFASVLSASSNPAAKASQHKNNTERGFVTADLEPYELKRA